MVPSGATGSGASMTATEMSATGRMLVLVVAALFAGSGSDVSAETAAVLVAGPMAGAAKTIERRGAAPSGTSALVQVMTPDKGGSHVHPSPDPEPVVTPTGSVSVTVTPELLSGPALV